MQETKTLLASAGASTQREMLLTEMLFDLRISKDAEPSPDVPLLCTVQLGHVVSTLG